MFYESVMAHSSRFLSRAENVTRGGLDGLNRWGIGGFCIFCPFFFSDRFWVAVAGFGFPALVGFGWWSQLNCTGEWHDIKDDIRDDIRDDIKDDIRRVKVSLELDDSWWSKKTFALVKVIKHAEIWETRAVWVTTEWWLVESDKNFDFQILWSDHQRSFTYCCDFFWVVLYPSVGVTNHPWVRDGFCVKLLAPSEGNCSWPGNREF